MCNGTCVKVPRYKWEPYRDTNWWCIDYFQRRGGHTLAKAWEMHRDTFHKYQGHGRFGFPDFGRSPMECWGYGIAVLQALEFLNPEPDIW